METNISSEQFKVLDNVQSGIQITPMLLWGKRYCECMSQRQATEILYCHLLVGVHPEEHTGI